MENIQLVICYIDSTLVTTDRRLTWKTKEVIDRLHAHGVLFGIASGRPLDELKRNAKKWGFSYPFDILIGMNGSELWDEKRQEEFGYYKLKPEWIKEIIELMEPFDANYFIYHDGYLLCRRNDAMMQHSAKSSDKEIVVMDTPEQLYQKENAKIMFRVTEEVMPSIERYVAQHPSPFYKGFKTQSTLMEFADHRVSKAFALKKYCEMNQLSFASVVAFGDTSNDNDMLACSGLGVCMCNGSADTKAIADDITKKSNDEEGFAWYMEEHFLKPFGW